MVVGCTPKAEDIAVNVCKRKQLTNTRASGSDDALRLIPPHVMSIEEALMAYMEYPDKMHDLIKFLTDWELEMAEGICSHLHPDMIFHHDDWGSEKNSFLRSLSGF